MTAIPDTGTWYNGELDTSPQQYDVLVSARGDVSGSTTQKLDLVVTPYKTPDFFELNSQRKLLVAEPKPMGTLSLPRGHDCRWVTIELKTVNGKATTALSDMEKHVCLGIRKQGDSQYLDVLNSEHLSTTTDLSDAEQLELIPLLSKSASEYSAIEPRTEYPPSDSDYKPSGQFNFGSVFRVSATINSSSWMSQQSNLIETSDTGKWYNNGRLGVGPVTTQNGETFDNQLLAISYNGYLTRSPDGIHWFFDMGRVTDADGWWEAGPVYANGTWCIARNNANDIPAPIWWSTDGGKTWNKATGGMLSMALAFGEGTFVDKTFNETKIGSVFFINSANRTVFTSPDAKSWNKVASTSTPVSNITYGNGNWIATGTYNKIAGYTPIYNSGTDIIDGKWDVINSDLPKSAQGSCYVNGYFYVTCNDGAVYRSADIENWKKVKTCGGSARNITYYKNRLYVIDLNGACHIGLFNSDGSINIEE